MPTYLARRNVPMCRIHNFVIQPACSPTPLPGKLWTKAAEAMAAAVYFRPKTDLAQHRVRHDIVEQAGVLCQHRQCLRPRPVGDAVPRHLHLQKKPHGELDTSRLRGRFKGLAAETAIALDLSCFARERESVVSSGRQHLHALAQAPSGAASRGCAVFLVLLESKGCMPVSFCSGLAAWQASAFKYEGAPSS